MIEMLKLKSGRILMIKTPPLTQDFMKQAEEHVHKITFEGGGYSRGPQTLLILSNDARKQIVREWGVISIGKDQVF